MLQRATEYIICMCEMLTILEVGYVTLSGTDLIFFFRFGRSNAQSQILKHGYVKYLVQKTSKYEGLKTCSRGFMYLFGLGFSG